MRILLLTLCILSVSACGDTAPKQDAEQTALEARRLTRVKQMAEAYTGEIRYKDSFNALDPLIKRSSVTRGSKFDATDDYWGLPRTAGYEEVAAYCSGCHSLAIVMQQQVTPERWEYLLNWMVEKQNMPPLETNERALVKAYIVQHFSADNQ